MTEKVENSNFHQNFTRDSKIPTPRLNLVVFVGRNVKKTTHDCFEGRMTKKLEIRILSKISPLSGKIPVPRVNLVILVQGGYKNTHPTWNCYFEGRMTEKIKKNRILRKISHITSENIFKIVNLPRYQGWQKYVIHPQLTCLGADEWKRIQKSKSWPNFNHRFGFLWNNAECNDPYLVFRIR
jgi:hypothetical protein